MGRPHPQPLLTACLTSLWACAPCPTLEQASVWDPHDHANPEQVLAIQHTMADFAAWTGMSDLCVLGVKIQRLPGADIGGIYSGPGSWIRMDPDALVAPERVVRHELCHAYDDAGGWVSGAYPEIFLVEDVERCLAYWTDRSRIRESFADACGNGPFDRGLELGIEQTCGVELLRRRLRWVMQQVYVNYEHSWPWLGSAEIGLERVALDDHDKIYRIVAADRWIYALVGEDPDGEGHALAPPPDEEDDDPQTDLRDGFDDFVLRLDPATGRELDRISLEDLELGRWTYLELFGGRGDPLLVAVGLERTRAWRVDTKAGSLDELTMPKLGYLKSFGTVRGDRAWLVGAVGKEPYTRPFEVDLRTGAWREFGCADAGAEGLDLESIQDLGDALLLRHQGYSSHDLVRYDPDRGTCHRTPLPEYSDIDIRSVVELDDGRQVLALRAEAEAASLDLLAVHDPAEGGWRMDPGQCTPGWDDESLGAIGWRNSTLMAVDGRALFPAWVPDADGNDHWVLVRLELP